MKNKYFYLPLIIISMIVSDANGYQKPRSEDLDQLHHGQSVIAPFQSAPICARLFIENNRLFTYVSVNGSREQLFVIDNAWSHTTIDPRLLKL